MTGRPFGIDGVRIGHHTDRSARTGCTVVLFDRPVVAAGEVRGGAPATRDFALLEPTAAVGHIDAVVLTGGSAFGLAAADGVMRWCEEHGRGFPTSAGRVPIVPTLALFDLPVGNAAVRPTAGNGHAAAAEAAASDGSVVRTGPVGAGTGARVGSWLGPTAAIDAGLGHAVLCHRDLVVAALVAVNAWGSIVSGELPSIEHMSEDGFGPPDPPALNTTIGVVVTNARLTKTQCRSMAVAGHAGLARAIYPANTPVDGDALVTAATGASGVDPTDGDLMALLALSDAAVAAAIRSLS